MTMDRKTIIAIALSVLFLVLYQPILRMLGLGHYLDRKQPQRTEQVAGSDSTATGSGTDSASSPDITPLAGAVDPAAVPPSPEIAAPPFKPSHAALEKTVALETPLYRATFSSRGARVTSVSMKKYASAYGASALDGKIFRPKGKQDVPPTDRVVMVGAPTFGLDLGAGTTRASLGQLVYAVDESLGVEGQVRALTFTAADSAGMYIRQTFRVRPQDYAIDYEVELRGIPRSLGTSEYSLNTRSWPLFTETDRAADERGNKASSLVGSNVHREGHGLVKGSKTFDGNAMWAGVQSRYFMAAAAVVDGAARGVLSEGERIPLTAAQRELLPPNASQEQTILSNALVMALPSDAQPVNRFVLYFGPTEYKRLAALGYGFDRAVDLGWRWLEPFSKALLQIMNWLYGVLRNYGVAILLLATLVRLVLHPLNMTSMRSMRNMQKLQPEIERIRTKHKDNPQAMNTAMMALYKEHKVNPAGGCLPLILQMPLFIALYSVLYNAIELRQAPFMLWMNDLSAPDVVFEVAGFPIRLLPVLMAATGLLQQRMMPMDPRQAPMMYMMNVMMLVFFYNLPSGLVLYWTVMNVLTMLQQWLMSRQDGGASPVPASSAVVVEEPEKPRGRKRRARQAMAKKGAGK